jgi:hypothetical protein
MQSPARFITRREGWNHRTAFGPNSGDRSAPYALHGDMGMSTPSPWFGLPMVRQYSGTIPVADIGVVTAKCKQANVGRCRPL